MPWPETGPVVLDAGDFCRLAEEIRLRVLERAIDWTGDEGPVELGKLEALFGALTDAIEAARAAPAGAARFRRTLAGAVVALTGGASSSSALRRGGQDGPALPRNRLNQTRTSAA